MSREIQNWATSVFQRGQEDFGRRGAFYSRLHVGFGMPDSPKETRNLFSKNGMLKVIGDDCFTALRSCQELLEEFQKDDPTIVWDTLNAGFREPRCETDSLKIDAY